jgi:hypothetical protein
MVPALGMAVATGASFMRLGGVTWLFLTIAGAALAILWAVRACRAGDAQAPAARNPTFVRQVSTLLRTMGGILLIGLLVRVRNDWQLLNEPGNLALGGLCVVLLAASVYVPIEWGRTPLDRSK